MAHRTESAIHRAVMLGSLPALLNAIAQANDIDAVDREGRTSLFYAVQDGNIQMATVLIEHGASVNARDNHLESPLHFSARAHRPEIAELLLRSGAKVDAQDELGNTPLWRAVFESRGRSDMISVLKAAGADKTIKNNHGVSPEDLANSIANYDVRTPLNP